MTLLSEYVTDLRELQGVDFETYAEEKLIRRTVERMLHLAVEACLDIGHRIIACEGLRIPEDNKDVFAVLSEGGIVAPDLLPNLVAMARFRNLVVHNYARIDDTVVFGILKRRLADFDAYAASIVQYLEGHRT